MIIQTTSALSQISADSAKRTISGLAVPWGTFARVSSGDLVCFAPDSVALSERAKLVVDHDASQPVGVLASSSSDEVGLWVTFKIPPGARGDEALADAGAGLRDGLSISADVDSSSPAEQGGIVVTASTGRHVALVSDQAYPAALVTSVAAQAPPPEPEQEHPTMPEPTPATQPTAEVPQPTPEATVAPVVATAARALVEAAGSQLAYVRAEPYPYTIPHHHGGPSFILDAWAAQSGEKLDGADPDRWRRAEAMATDPRAVNASLPRFDPVPLHLNAAAGTSTSLPDLHPVRQMPERFVPLVAAKAPLWTVIRKFPTPDFRTIDIPRTVTETGLSGTGADEVTPVAPGTITTSMDAISITEVEGSYEFSRKLLMGSNPSIDQIALDALDRAWLADVEARAVAFFTLPANSTAWGGTYADGLGYTQALRALYASIAAATKHIATDTVPASKEYQAAAIANDTTSRPLLPYGNGMNTAGKSDAAYASLDVQGVPLWPGPYMSANHTLVLDQNSSSAAAFATPVMNFRLEWTTDVATGGNVKVLKLVKYSGVGFWCQYKDGIQLVTNTTPLTLDGPEGLVWRDDEPPATKGAKK